MVVFLKGTMNRKKSCQQPDTLLTEAPANFEPTAPQKCSGATSGAAALFLASSSAFSFLSKPT